jgi:hypothetical protein
MWYEFEQKGQEVEPGMVYLQKCDLEGFFLNGTQLTVLGENDFQGSTVGLPTGAIFNDVKLG